MVWFAVETARRSTASSSTATSCSCWPARRTATAAGGDRRAAHRAGARDGGRPASGSEEAGPAGRAARSCSSTARWTARPGCSSCPGASTTDYRVLRYDRRGYGRSTPHDGPFDDRRPRSTTSSAARRAAGRRVRPQLRRQRGAGPGRPPPGAGAGRRRLRDAAVVARLVADDDRRRRRAAVPTTADAPIRPTPPSGSCAGWSATSGGRGCPSATRTRPAGRGRGDGRRAAPTCAAHRALGPGRRSTSRSWRCAGQHGAEHHRRSTRPPGARRWPTARVVEIDGRPPLRPEHPPRRRRRRSSPTSSPHARGSSGAARTLARSSPRRRSRADPRG